MGDAVRWRRGSVAALTAACWTMYVSVAVWLVEGRDFMIGDSVSRTLSAKLMVLSRDPHLASIGFYWMPIPTVTRIPFVYLLDPFGHAILAGPVTSALFAAATVPVLFAIGGVLSLRRAVTTTVVAAFALNPATIWAGANGMSESTFGFFLAVAVLMFLRWRRSSDSRHLVLFGLAVAACAACRHETLVLLPPILVAVGAAVGRDRRRSAVTLAAVPTLALLVGWAIVSKLITGEWLFWYNASRPTTAMPPGAQWVPGELNPVTAVVHVAGLLLAYSPAIIPVAIVAASVRRAGPSWLLLGGTVLLLPAVLAWQLADGSSWMVPRFLVHTPLLGAVAVLFAVGVANEPAADVRFATFGDAVARIAARCAVAAVVVGAFTSTWYLADSDRSHAEGEYVFLSALLGRDDPRAEPGFDTSNEVFFSDLRPFRELVAELDPRLADGGRVVMDSLQAVPVLLSAHADRFIVPEDRDFEEILSDPAGRFDHIVVSPPRAETDFSRLIAAELERTDSDGGVWNEIGRYADEAILYEFVPAPGSG